MRTQLIKSTLAVSIGLALAFTFYSCGSDDDEGSGSLADHPEYQLMVEELKYYDSTSTSSRCGENGIVERKCGEVWYNPLTQGCSETNEGENVVGTLEICGNRIYNSRPNNDNGRRCNGGVYERLCQNGTWYNVETHDCRQSYQNGSTSYELIAAELCGNEYYYPNEGYRRCEAGVVQENCGSGETGEWYSRKTHYCSRSSNPPTVKLIETCGLQEVSYYYQRCNSGVYEELCGSSGDTWYNPITQSCNRNDYTVKNKTRCGN